MPFDTKGFKDELGDTELTMDTYNQAPVEDELGELHYPEPKAQESEPAPEPAKEPVKQPEQESEKPVSVEEQIKLMRLENELYQKRFAEYMDAKVQSLQPKQVEQEPQEEEYSDPYTRLERQSEDGRKTAQAALGLAERAAERLMRADFERTLDKLTKENPDLHEFLPKERLTHVLEAVVKAKQFDTNWEAEIGKAYQSLSFNKYRDHYRQSTDELAKKREEKKTESSKAARAVPPGGNVYQPEKTVDLNPFNNKNFQKDRKAAFLAELNALAGG